MLIRVLSVLVLMDGPGVALEFRLPIDCQLGEDCFIQQYVDRDRGPGIEDYTCGAQTYNGHKGTDIRVRTVADVEKHVAVLAAASGVVVGRRDGIPDRLVRTDKDRARVAKLECGNGVRIDHGEGWQTQYCHLRQGSVRVKKRQQVAAGTKLGEVGYSGNADFPHVHLQVTKNGSVVDPFIPDATISCGKARKSLWSASALAALTYQPGTILAVGFADHAMTLKELEEGTPLAKPTRHTPVVAYIRAINLQQRDLVYIAVTYEGNVVTRNSERLERNKAQLMLFAGKKAPPGGWLEGTYASEAQVIRGGKPVIKGSQTLVVR